MVAQGPLALKDESLALLFELIEVGQVGVGRVGPPPGCTRLGQPCAKVRRPNKAQAARRRISTRHEARER